jgi:hypothetical protein
MYKRPGYSYEEWIIFLRMMNGFVMFQ